MTNINDKLNFPTDKEEYKSKLTEVEQKLKKHDLNEAELKKALLNKEELDKQKKDFEKKEAELSKIDKDAPWNIDTICKEGFSTSRINKSVILFGCFRFGVMSTVRLIG